MKKFGQTKNQNPKTIIGIDYSLTSPAVCVNHNGKINFYYLTSKKKYVGEMSKNIIGCEHKEYKTPIHRFSQISDWAFDIIKETFHSSQKIYIEGYSFGSKGRGIFQIAENCGILKYRLQEHKIHYDTIVPSVVKKLASGKGNADKEKMYQSFVEHTNVDLKKLFDMEKLNNPVTDIIDSFYIAKFGYDNMKNQVKSS